MEQAWFFVVTTLLPPSLLSDCCYLLYTCVHLCSIFLQNLKLEGTKDLSDVLVQQEDRARGGGPRSHSDQDAHTWG